jgi:hypothetical protein
MCQPYYRHKAFPTQIFRMLLYVSNLRRFIEAMGGTLEVVAHFPEGSVTITNFCEVEAAETDDTPEHTR